MKEQSALPVAHCLPGTVVAESSPGIRRARAASVGVRHRRAGPTGGRGSAVTAATGSATTSATSSAAAATTVAVVLTVILGTEALAASASATATSATAAREAEAVAHALKPLGHLLVVLREELDQLLGDVAVLVVHQGQRVTHVADTAGTTNAVHVILHSEREGVVDHILHLGNVETSGGHISGDQQGNLASLELLQGRSTVLLGLVAVDGGHVVALALQTHLQVRGFLFVQNEDQNAVLAGLVVLLQQALQLGILLMRLHALDNLRHTVVRAELVAAHGHLEQVLVQVLVGQVADLLRPGGTEHDRLALGQVAQTSRVLTRRGTAHRANLANDGLEALIKHSVCLVQHQVAHLGQRQRVLLDEVHQSAGSGNHDLRASVQRSLLHVLGHTSVNAHTLRATNLLHHLLTLHGQLSGRGNNQDLRSRLVARALAVSRAALRFQSLYPQKSRNQKAQSLSGTSSSNTNHVSTSEQRSPALRLDRTGLGEVLSLQILRQIRTVSVQRRIQALKGSHRLVCLTILLRSHCNTQFIAMRLHFSGSQSSSDGVFHVQPTGGFASLSTLLLLHGLLLHNLIFLILLLFLGLLLNNLFLHDLHSYFVIRVIAASSSLGRFLGSLLCLLLGLSGGLNGLLTLEFRSISLARHNFQLRN
mmetsp:Transcript_45103/g.78754  ORF Transcript_45103/g.78754 Transcript_45103/m.78754 type:complete len:649 (-) Transcript_45103:3-1949(-)